MLACTCPFYNSLDKTSFVNIINKEVGAIFRLLKSSLIIGESPPQLMKISTLVAIWDDISAATYAVLKASSQHQEFFLTLLSPHEQHYRHRFLHASSHGRYDPYTDV